MKTYSEKLKDPRWQKKRLEILERDGWQCRACGNSKLTLHVHHCFYVKNQSPWEHDECYLKTFCESCHDRYHKAKEALNQKIALLDPGQIEDLDLVLQFHGIYAIHHLCESIKSAYQCGESTK